MQNAPYKGPAQVFLIPVLPKPPRALAGSAPTHAKDSSQAPPHSLPAPWPVKEESPPLAPSKRAITLFCAPGSQEAHLSNCVFGKSRSPQHRRHFEEEALVQLCEVGLSHN